MNTPFLLQVHEYHRRGVATLYAIVLIVVHTQCPKREVSFHTQFGNLVQYTYCIKRRTYALNVLCRVLISIQLRSSGYTDFMCYTVMASSDESISQIEEDNAILNEEEGNKVINRHS